MKTHEELMKAAEKYYKKLLESGLDEDAIQDRIVMYLEGDSKKHTGDSKYDQLKEKIESDMLYLDENPDGFVYIDNTSAINGCLAKDIADVLCTLTTREIFVLSCRFADEFTLEETSNLMNVTRERVRQVEYKALRKLRHPSRSNRMRGYLESETIIDYNPDVSYIVESKETEQNYSAFLSTTNFCSDGPTIYTNIDKSSLLSKSITKENYDDTKKQPEKVTVDDNVTYHPKKSISMLKSNCTRNITSCHYILNRKKSVTNTIIALSDILSYTKYDVVYNMSIARYNDIDAKEVNTITSMIKALPKCDEDVDGRIKSIFAIVKKYTEKSDRQFTIDSLYDLNYAWAEDNKERLPYTISKMMEDIHDMDQEMKRRYGSIKLFYDNKGISIAEFIDEYIKLTDDKDILEEMNNIKAKINLHSKFIVAYDKYSSNHNVTNNNSEEWKKQLKIILEMRDGRKLKKKRDKLKEIKIHEYTVSIDDKIVNPPLSIRKSVVFEKLIIRLRKQMKRSDFETSLALAYRSLVYSDLYNSREIFSRNLYEYRNFIKSNSKWIKQTICNMIDCKIINRSKRVLDLKSKPCSSIDNNMVSYTVKTLFRNCGYASPSEYRGKGFIVNDGLDYHYIAIMDIIYILRYYVKYKMLY